MELIKMYLKELEQEAKTTRKFLALIPNDQLDWQPHPKSMTIRTLATHIAELPSWVTLALTTDELDFAKGDYKPTTINNANELSVIFEKKLEETKTFLIPENEAKLSENWVLRNGETIIGTMTKSETIRHAFCQTVHHRAQLGVFLRLLNIPIPGSYGPSADDKGF